MGENAIHSLIWLPTLLASGWALLTVTPKKNALRVFTLHVLFRALSGLQNGLYYGRQIWPMLGVSLFMLGLIAYMWYAFEPKKKWARIAYKGLLIASAIATVIMAWGLYTGAWRYIHLVEYFVTGGVALALLLIDWKATALSLYVGLLLHKMLVNIPAGLAWNFNGTDDPTGATVGVWIFGMLVKLPRTNFQTRIIIAAVSVAAFLVIELLTPYLKKKWKRKSQ